MSEMARKFILVRNDAEWLVDLLEGDWPTDVEQWISARKYREEMADDIRELFGMCSRDEQRKRND
jgi:hypothetical protein